MMECNKDEAVRAKEIAERKFNEGDFAGAKKFALKAQTLYPGLENISQMLTTLEVYLSAENKINGETDMYAILGVSPLADDETIKKTYKKLVLLLHPDKNKFTGADGAFQLVKEAFNLLSDKVKRSAYNSRRSVRTAQQTFPTQGGAPTVPARTGKKVDLKVPQGGVSGASRPSGQTYRSPGQQKVPNPTQSGSPSVPPGVNGHHKPATSSTRGKAQRGSTQKASPTVQSFFSKGDTFWTACTRCKMQYEYMRVYLGHTLNCPHCKVGFVAIEIAPPSNLSPFRPKQQQQQQLKSSSGSGSRVSGFSKSVGAGGGARWSPSSGTTAYNNISSSEFVPGSTTSASQPMNNSGKREREEPHGAARWERRNDSGFVFTEESSKKRREDMGHTTPGQTGFGSPAMGTAFGQCKKNSEAERAHFPQGISLRYNFHRELPPTELRKMLTEKALMEIRNKLKEWKSFSEAKAAAKEKAKVKGKDRHKPSLATSATHTEQEAAQIALMSVPDPDFHVFDLDRSENCFKENQVWAAYDDDDGMPRFYALIHEVISLDPFEVRMSWLNSKSNNEFSSVDWVGRGFIKTCGDFWVGKHVTNNSLNSFSHKVEWVKGPRGVVRIYPRQGEIWALYRQWSPDWDQGIPDEIKHSYDMVEILKDYNEERGVPVALLCKATGFHTVFYKQQDPKEVKSIPKVEMFRFSHQVPSHVLTGEEKSNAPKGYVELDPAATPADLLKVIKPDNKETATW